MPDAVTVNVLAVTVPGLPEKIALPDCCQTTFCEPSHQIAVVASHVPVPPDPPTPHDKSACAEATAAHKTHIKLSQNRKKEGVRIVEFHGTAKTLKPQCGHIAADHSIVNFTSGFVDDRR